METVPDVLTEEYRRTFLRRRPPLLNGLDAAAYGLTGRWRRRASVRDGILRRAADVDAQSPRWRDKSDMDLRERLMEFRGVFRRQRRDFETFLPSSLAAIREAARRRLGLNPHVVQLAGALALYDGCVAEMATGEGKTLTAGLAAVVRGWIGRPFHLITVNDYLAARDARWMAPLYSFCGVSAGCVTSDMDPEARRRGYANDVAYTTSKEIVADFLRDRILLGAYQNFARRQIRDLFNPGRSDRGLVLRGVHAGLVDEADSVLIDEAVTPLIISRSHPNGSMEEAYRAVQTMAGRLAPGTDYRVDPRHKDIEFLPGAEERLAAESEQLPGLFRGSARRNELVRQALVAREFFRRDVQYVVQNGKVVIVDEFTGRLMPQRTWREGLHQMIEARENVAVTSPGETLARLSFQRFFRFFHHLSGMTGTARESAGELWHIYGLPVISIPENRPCVRRVLPRRVFAEVEPKISAIVEETLDVVRQGRPVLIGTRSVRASETLAERLVERGFPPRVLNAVRHDEEAAIIADAGQAGRITVATNMAGRGTDILLGKGVAKAGGLHVIASECHESARVDRQLFGRSARQGDPGSARSFVSLEDELIRRFLPAFAREGVRRLGEKTVFFHARAADQCARWAQARAQKLAFVQRRSVLGADTWLEDSLSFAPADVNL